MKKQNYQLRIVITQGKEVLAEVKMRRDTLADLPNVPSLPGTIYNMIGDLCRLQAANEEADTETADAKDDEPAPPPLPPRVRSYPWQQRRSRNPNPNHYRQRRQRNGHRPLCPPRST